MNNTRKLMMVAFLSASALGLSTPGFSSNEDVDASSADMQQLTAEGNLEVALAKADADHKVAVEQCKAMTGDARSTCKDEAGAALDVAQAQAEADKLAADPKN